ncbi:MAG: CPBP family intramembrane glutamic endopeptidase [Planctomycetota bacterium]|jgi:hypothetical protein
MSDAEIPAPPQGPLEGSDTERSSLTGLVRDILGLDRLAVAILVTVPVSLTLLEFYGLPWHYTRHSVGRETRMAADRDPPFVEWIGRIDFPGPPALRPYLWWGIACIVLLVLIPMAVGAAFGASPRRLGVRLKGTGRDALTYGLLFLVFFPVIWLVSRSPEFRNTYPFYPRDGSDLGVDFLVFEAVYCLQFFAIEFFFRGFMVLGLKPRLGTASVLVMLAPYCMIHYYKPFPEAMGAIGAGLVLGMLAWRTGTIMYGWFLHYAVALSMDLLALGQSGRL